MVESHVTASEEGGRGGREVGGRCMAPDTDPAATTTAATPPPPCAEPPPGAGAPGREPPRPPLLRSPPPPPPPCGHTFCILCLRRWLLTRPECPACRRPATNAHFFVNAVAHRVVGVLWRYRRLPAPPSVVIPPCVPGDAAPATDTRGGRPGHLPFLPVGLTSVATFRFALATAGLPTTGDRSALATRHVEYVARHYAAVDGPSRCGRRRPS